VDEDRSETGPTFDAWPMPAAQPAVPVADLQADPPALPRKKRTGWWIGGTVVVVAALVAALVTTGSGDGHPQSAIQVLSAAASRTTGSGTAHLDLTVSLSENGESQTIMTGSSDTDFATKDTSAEITAGGMKMTVRQIGGTAYMSATGVPLPGNAEWISFTPGDIAGSTQAEGALGSQDPSSGLAYLNAVNGNPTVVDTETLDGVHVTHYRFTLDLKTLMARLAQAGKSLGAGGLFSNANQLGSLVDLSAVPGEAWIDAAGRVRKFQYELTITTAGQTISSIGELRASQFGEAVHVSAPPAADTVPFSQDRTYFSDLQAAAANAAGGDSQSG